MTDLVPSIPAALALIEAAAQQARDYATASRADSTKRAYQGDWQDFVAWCGDAELASLPAVEETVALYLASRAETLKVATLTRRLAAISQAHQLAGYPSPTRSERVRTVLKGIRRTKGVAQRQVAAATVEVLKTMLVSLPESLPGTRDRALLLIGFAAALRRSELVALDVADIEFVPQGMVVVVRKSKTDQEGAGRQIAIPYGQQQVTCPVRSLKAWLSAAKLTEGPIFRGIDKHGHIRKTRLTDRSVALIIKRAATAAGLESESFSGHSLRAGLATSAAAAGAADREIAAQTGHRSMQVLGRYVRKGRLFERNVAGRVGL